MRKIQPSPEEKTPLHSGSFRTTAGLPADFLEAASNRLRIASLLYAITYATVYSTRHLVEQSWGRQEHLIADVWSIAAIIAASGLYFLLRAGRLEPARTLQAGLVFWVVGALAIDFPLYYYILNVQLPLIGISWVCVWLVVFPLIVPSTPRRILVSAVAAASMGPVAFLLASALTGQGKPPGMDLIQTFLPYYLSTAMALIAARIVHGWGKAVREARELGSYKLVRLLGQGGMGEVWLAEHRLLARPAAVKLIKPDEIARSQGSVESVRSLVNRFEREAQATATLHSPHTVGLYDFGVTAEGEFYYAMELLEGLDLESLVKRFGPITASRATFLLMQACDSLDDAHCSGLVHRDVKPGNIYICRMGCKFDFVKVLDFGLVKSIEEEDGEGHRLTQAGMVTGTPAYLAPEMALGQNGVDCRADIYSLGCTAYWLLTGRQVFEGRTAMEVIVRHVQDLPVPPSRATELCIDGGLEEIVMKCLEKDPAKRPQTAGQLSEMLSYCSFEEPWSNGKAERWWELHRPTAVAADIETAPARPSRPATTAVVMTRPKVS